MSCIYCGRKDVSDTLSVCVDCIRDGKIFPIEKLHRDIRKQFLLPPTPPEKSGIRCHICSNECVIDNGHKGYCGLRENVNDKLVTKVSKNNALAYTYLDPLPTNCCASWFCPESTEYGYNLATFFYGCNFDCLFCQNYSHKSIYNAPIITVNDFVSKVKDNTEIRCICYFGGSPEPQLPFAINASQKVLKERMVRICWEWNGCGNPNLVKKAALLSLESGGIIKFDLKAYNNNLSLALSGVSNKQAYKNFDLIANFYGSSILTATTLLVPYYVDMKEVEGIAKFIASIDPNIPYSLLVFHPDFYMRDLPITPRRQVEECYEVAKMYLRKVNIGNKHLLI